MYESLLSLESKLLLYTKQSWVQAMLQKAHNNLIYRKTAKKNNGFKKNCSLPFAILQQL